jgi:DNA mismatch endonuclease Vsr
MVKPSRRVSYNMSRIRSKGTLIEKILSSKLARLGIRGYRRNSASIFGKPDFSWGKTKVAVFCDSSFWHGYKFLRTKKHDFKRNRKFWLNKILRNIERDKEVNKALRNKGWRVLRFWDFQIEGDTEQCIKKIAKTIKS